MRDRDKVKRRVDRQKGGESTGPLQSGHKMETGTEAAAAVVTLHFTERERGSVCEEKGIKQPQSMNAKTQTSHFSTPYTLPLFPTVSTNQ